MCCQLVCDNLLWLLQTTGLHINILNTCTRLQFFGHTLPYKNYINREPVNMWTHAEKNVDLLVVLLKRDKKFLHVRIVIDPQAIFFISIDVAKKCKLVHVVRMFIDKPLVCSNHNKLSQISWQHLKLAHVGRNHVAKTLPHSDIVCDRNKNNNP